MDLCVRVCYSDVESTDDPVTSNTGGNASAVVLDSWEDGASSTPEDGTAKPIVHDNIDFDGDIDMDADEDKPKCNTKKAVEEIEPKPKKEHINIVIIGHVGKKRLPRRTI